MSSADCPACNTPEERAGLIEEVSRAAQALRHEVRGLAPGEFDARLAELRQVLGA